MDSVTQLALISKAKNVFGNEGTFLSFPVTPLAYKKEALDFFSQDTGAELIKSKENLYAFSILVNLIPKDEAWLPTETRFLWDEYEYALNQGICATSTRTTEEENAFQEAKAYLRVRGDDGLMQSSPQYLVYKQYRDAYFMISQEFMEARSTGESTTNEAEKKQWEEVDEPAFRARLKEIENTWILEGNKNEVEIAQSKLVLLGAKSPSLTWAEWLANFNPDIDSEISAFNLSQIFPSSFAPLNALEEGSWKSFSLNESEIKALVSSASKNLRKRFSANSKESSIKSLSLEFSSAAVNRPWFDSELFRSRFWKLSDSTLFSDGGIPPSGQCPSYVTAIVFARNVIVKEKKNKKTPPDKNSPLDFRSNFNMKNQNIRINPDLRRVVQPQMMIQQPLQMRQSPQRTNRSEIIHPENLPIKKQFRVKPNLPTVQSNTHLNLNLKKNLKKLTFNRLPIKPIRKLLPKKPGKAPDKNIYILAFICKPLPKCPDPDMTLQW